MNRFANLALAGVVAVGLLGAAYAADSTDKSVTGTLEDSYCYGTMGAKGAGHKECAMKCASKGIPVVLIEKGTEKSYIILPPQNEQPVPDSVIKHMEDEVTVTGKEYNKNGIDYLTADSVK
jgi:hypothetical protein